MLVLQLVCNGCIECHHGASGKSDADAANAGWELSNRCVPCKALLSNTATLVLPESRTCAKCA